MYSEIDSVWHACRDRAKSIDAWMCSLAEQFLFMIGLGTSRASKAAETVQVSQLICLRDAQSQGYSSSLRACQLPPFIPFKTAECLPKQTL